MILYLDTSALIKRYFLEKFSGDVIAIWQSADQVVTSFVAYGETMACIYRTIFCSPASTTAFVTRQLQKGLKPSRTSDGTIETRYPGLGATSPRPFPGSLRLSLRQPGLWDGASFFDFKPVIDAYTIEHTPPAS